MQTVLIFIAVLSIVVVVHELGHFSVAKLAGIRVLEFGLGYPPRIFGFRRGETVYSLNLLPLGGFVRFVGEEDPTDPDSLARRPAWIRLAVLAAGPGMNFLLPLLLFTILFMVPRAVPVTDVVITSVAPDSPAALARLQPGDIVHEVDGRQIDNSSDLLTVIQLNLGARTDWVVQRGDGLVETSLVPRVDPPEGELSVGLSSIVDARTTIASVTGGSTAQAVGLAQSDLVLWVGNRLILQESHIQQAIDAARTDDPNAAVPLAVLRRGEIVEMELAPGSASLTGMELDVRPDDSRSEPIWEAVPSSFGQMWDILVISKNELSKWISGSSSAAPVAGPIGIAQLTGEVAKAGLSALVFWTALLSLSLAILNILPIPALDGGRITFVLLELARGGRRIPPKREALVHLIGFATLMAFIVFISINDIQRIVGGESLVSP